MIRAVVFECTEAGKVAMDDYVYLIGVDSLLGTKRGFVYCVLGTEMRRN